MNLENNSSDLNTSEHVAKSIFEVDGQLTPTSWITGSLLMLFSLPGLVCNVLCMIVLIKYGFLKEQKQNPNIHRYAFSLLISDTMSLLNMILYGIPSCISQTWLLRQSLLRIPGIVMNLSWNVMQMHLGYVALERYLAVCRPNLYTRINGYNTSLAVIAGAWIVGLLLTIVNQYVLPCCPLYFWFKVYTAAYIPFEPYQYSKKMNLGLQIITTGVLCMTYMAVLLKLREANRQVSDTTEQSKRKAQEARLAKQFLMISSFFVITFVLFRILPFLVPADMSWMWVSISILISINNGINGVIYLKYNPKMKTAAKVFLGMAKKEELTQTMAGWSTKAAASVIAVTEKRT